MLPQWGAGMLVSLTKGPDEVELSRTWRRPCWSSVRAKIEERGSTTGAMVLRIVAPLPLVCRAAGWSSRSATFSMRQLCPELSPTNQLHLACDGNHIFTHWSLKHANQKTNQRMHSTPTICSKTREELKNRAGRLQQLLLLPRYQLGRSWCRPDWEGSWCRQGWLDQPGCQLCFHSRCRCRYPRCCRCCPCARRH